MQMEMVLFILHQWADLFQNVDIDIKRSIERTLLQYACEKGHLLQLDWRIYAISFCHSPYNGNPDIVKHLVSKAATKNAKNIYGKTSYFYTNNDEMRNTLKYKWKQNIESIKRCHI